MAVSAGQNQESIQDLARNRVAICEMFEGQREAARERGANLERVTVFVDRISHRLPGGRIRLSVLKSLIGRPMLHDDKGVELTDDSVFDLVGGEAFFTHAKGHQGF
jgi:hypothetical protein